MIQKDDKSQLDLSENKQDLLAISKILVNISKTLKSQGYRVQLVKKVAPPTNIPVAK